MLQIGQTLLMVTKFTECVSFYRDALGFEIDRGSVDGPLVVFRSGGQRLGLYDREKLPSGLLPEDGKGEPSDGVVLVIVTDDVDGTHRKLVARGIQYVVEPKDFPEWGVRSSVCRDPEGNLLEIVTPPPVSS